MKLLKKEKFEGFLGNRYTREEYELIPKVILTLYSTQRQYIQFLHDSYEEFLEDFDKVPENSELKKAFVFAYRQYTNKWISKLQLCVDGLKFEHS